MSTQETAGLLTMRKGSANNEVCSFQPCSHLDGAQGTAGRNTGHFVPMVPPKRDFRKRLGDCGCVCVCVSGVTYELLKSQVLNKAVLVNMQCVYTTTTQQLLKTTLMKNSHTVHIHGYLYCPDAYNNSVLYTHTFSW